MGRPWEMDWDLFSLTEEAKEFPHEVLPPLFGIRRHLPPREPLSALSLESQGLP